MDALIVLAGIALLLVLILLKLHPAVSLLIAAVFTGLLFQMPLQKVMASVNGGIGATVGPLLMVLCLGAMLGKLVEDSGAATRLVQVMVARAGLRGVQWAVLATGTLVGIPLFYNAGFVVLVPLVFSIAGATGLPLLYVGLPMAASLSVTHGFLPPHPGPLALAAVFRADVGKTLLYGFILTVPLAVIAGILFTRLMIKPVVAANQQTTVLASGKLFPSFGKSLFVVALPVLFIAIGTIGNAVVGGGPLKHLFTFLQEPTLALLTALLLAIWLLQLKLDAAMASGMDGVKAIAPILLIIAAGGAFKQVLIDSGLGARIAEQAKHLQLHPLFFGWLIAALLRIALGSATVAAITASGLALPFVEDGASAELMVLAVGAGSIFCSHVNDTGFWMFKEYFGLTVKRTFQTWTVMESIISVGGLAGVLLLNQL